ncbi:MULTISPECIES: sulfur carrier protein ThiS [Micrococcaceae]|uniref:sulfur carrier protein ThiS n=1 Tax=Micrococcaceae TaxID=1268 RepID=UPI001036820C|nr:MULTISPECIES: sulfur carrier protein ThiS [Micrococcaceae]TAP27755.1 sulfur carrier protein ThiS [Arthrobacter sp. S41]UXN30564.1 sulfur carrier protein ThiS [Glutamicibacter sp. M10]
MTSISITVNNQPVQVDAGLSLREFIARHIGKELDKDSKAIDGSKLGLAAAVNGAVVPRSSWNGFAVQSGHTIELVTAAQGG